jgi:hypothetical protein
VLDDGVVLYVAGNCIILHAMEARTQVQLVMHFSHCAACPLRLSLREVARGMMSSIKSIQRCGVGFLAALHHAGG